MVLALNAEPVLVPLLDAPVAPFKDKNSSA
jgi:hypothetical protein